ncbi:cellulase family glycosylhydrolase [Nonomuraea sp. NPDC049649]|uniref:cellulase family glycosylhydrolase n=1 Tax=Nonomuraea sp. NPDC049649 TaxID=3155776 RepID=UPI00343F1158
MRSRLAALAALILLPVALISQPAHAATGIHVSGANIVESGGQNLILRGTSHPHAWYTGQTQSFRDIKSLGANAVRVVLSGGRWTPNNTADVAGVVSLCKQNKLICVLENHDTTGYGEQSGAYTLDQAADYWISVKSALVGQEDYVIVNIGNEPIGNNAVTPGWAAATSAAIQKLRSNGFDHALMVDAPNWGQDWQFTMRDNAQAVFDSDPDRNVIFSIHMYGVFDTAAEITAYMDAFKTAGLPLVVGEFGHDHSDGDPDEDTIMAQAVSRGLGYFGWSWSGNGGGVEYLDQVVNFDVNQLTSWGERLFNGTDGIRATAREAAIYGGGGPADTTPPTAPGTPSASDVTATGARLTWAASTDDVGVTGYDVYRSGGTLLGRTATTSITLSGLTPDTAYQVYVRARDAAGNQSAPSPDASFTTEPGSPGGGCSVTASVQSQWGSGYVAQATVTNTGSAAVDGWTVTFTLPAGHEITGYWNADITVSGQTVTARNVGYNGNLGPDASTGFGFQAGRPDGQTSVPSGYSCAT